MTDLTLAELDTRRARFIAAMSAAFPQWDTAVILGKVNQFYFSGTMQDAMLLIRRDGGYAYYARKSYDRARAESPLPRVYPMQTYRDAAEREDPRLGRTYIEGETAPYAMIERLGRYFTMDSVGSMDHVLKMVRAVKSPHELAWMERSGRQQDRLLTEAVPGLLCEGMSEAEFVGALLEAMMRYGYHGISRFTKFQTEIIGGQFAFGENSLYPTCFDGPGGTRGMGPAAPVTGDPDRRLKKGDLVFVDTGFGMGGYHSDKTQLYLFGAQPPAEAARAHGVCLDIMNRTAEALKPGALPSRIYRDIMATVPDDMLENFMGYPGHSVKFLGHGVGLHVDELPVIAQGFDAPLEENMTIALEPKRGLKGFGMVGVEDTYVVTPEGGRCITGGGRKIIVV